LKIFFSGLKNIEAASQLLELFFGALKKSSVRARIGIRMDSILPSGNMKKKILLTQSRSSSERLIESLERKGYECVIEPLLMIEHTLAPRPEGVFGAVWLASSSAAEILKTSGEDVSDILPLPCFCIGASAAEAARKAGFVIVQPGTLDSVARATIDSLKGKAKSILYICGDIVDMRAHAVLKEHGLALRKWQLYRAATLTDFSPETKAHFMQGKFNALSAFSRRGAQTLVSLIEKNGLKDVCSAIIAVGLSHAAAEALKQLPWKEVRVAARPDEEDAFANI